VATRVKLLIVLDRALSFGGPSGPVCSELQAALYPLEVRPKIISFVGGLGGRDISVEAFENMINRGLDRAERKEFGEFEMIEVRE